MSSRDTLTNLPRRSKQLKHSCQKFLKLCQYLDCLRNFCPESVRYFNNNVFFPQKKTSVCNKLKTFITKVDTSSIADRFTLIVIKLFLAQNTSRNNTYSGFNKEIIEKEDANLEHRDRSIVSISPPIFLLPGVSRPGRRGSRCRHT